MGVLRPEPMARVGLLGLKEDRGTVLTALHDLRVAQIEPLRPEVLSEMAPERGNDMVRWVGDQTLRFRGLMNALPKGPAAPPRRFANVDEVLTAAQAIPIDGEVGELKREDDRLQTEERTATETLELLDKLTFYPERLDLLVSRHLATFFGEGERERFDTWRSLTAEAQPSLLTGPGPDDSVRFLVIARPDQAELLARSAQKAGLRLVPIPALSATPGEERSQLAHRRVGIVRRRAEIAARLGAISAQWFPDVAAIDEALAVENRKIEALQKLGAGRASFALEAWVPEKELPRLEKVLEGLTGGRVHLYRIPTKDEPPTMMSNPRGVRRFEFFIRFYSLPQASEWDPTLVFAIVFPLFFGFMLGDWGYGLVILLISLWMIAGFPGGGKLPKAPKNFVKNIMGPQGMVQIAYALIPGCLLAIGLGLFWDEFFGAHLLLQTIGYHAPIAPDRNVGLLLLVAGYIGLAMVTLGFLFGALKEYFHHHPRGVVAKSGGIVFAWAIALAGLALIHHQASFSHPLFLGYVGLAFAGLLMLLLGEGIQMGMMGLIEVISHILSYTRLVGILLASVILALVINTVSFGQFAGGTALGLVAGAVILVVGQTFNVILGVFEPGIQGARLIFVEYFSKFYTGNGRAFRPFGGPRERTVSSLAPGAPVPPPPP